jgi:hypothetical protein
MAKSYWVAILPGDGIGPEIVDATLDVLETVQELSGQFSLIYEFHQAGAGCYRETGQPITDEALEAFQRANATLKGPVGLPDVRKPDGTEAGLLGGVLRVDFDLYANVRPIRLFPERPDTTGRQRSRQYRLHHPAREQRGALSVPGRRSEDQGCRHRQHDDDPSGMRTHFPLRVSSGHGKTPGRPGR